MKLPGFVHDQHPEGGLLKLKVVTNILKVHQESKRGKQERQQEPKNGKHQSGDGETLSFFQLWVFIYLGKPDQGENQPE